MSKGFALKNSFQQRGNDNKKNHTKTRKCCAAYQHLKIKNVSFEEYVDLYTAAYKGKQSTQKDMNQCIETILKSKNKIKNKPNINEYGFVEISEQHYGHPHLKQQFFEEDSMDKADCRTNIALEYECNDNNCRNGDNCFGTFATYEETKKNLEVESTTYGYGLFVKKHGIDEYEHVIEYIGVNLDTKKYNNAMERLKKSKKLNSYILQVGPGHWIDGAEKGNYARFFNHSCDPNLKCQKYVNKFGQYSVRFVAK
eukprot:79035_1